MAEYDYKDDEVFEGLDEPEFTDETFDEMTNGKGDDE